MVSRRRAETDQLTKAELEELSEFRYQLRRFLHFSEEIVHAEGITPLQYMLLLHIGGFPGGTGRPWANWPSGCKPRRMARSLSFPAAKRQVLLPVDPAKKIGGKLKCTC